MKILIVEDDQIIAEGLKNHLSKWNYEGVIVEDFKNILEAFTSTSPQMVLMDLSLPYYNGYHWCSEIRKYSKVPIIVISSASDQMNIVMAMNMGADDFITKPFDLVVVAAKIQALMRRTYDYQGQTNIIEHQGLILNLNDASLSYLGQQVDLTKNEYKILQVLLEHVGEIVTREVIMTKLWADESFIDDNTLTVNMTRLRRKVQDIGLEDLIITKKGIGYLII